MNQTNRQQQPKKARSKVEQHPLFDVYSYILNVSTMCATLPGAMAYGLVKHANHRQSAGRK